MGRPALEGDAVPPPPPPHLEDDCHFRPNRFCPPPVASNRFKTASTAPATAFQPPLTALATAPEPSLQPPSPSSTALGMGLVVL